ncbi:hypothetical protein J4447_02695 [Candidatus Pacearchaeota archaeon]|nr:hypothetical protein [Candidatus Pacearchaeota archaeon]
MEEAILTTKIRKWGNSYGIMIPKGFLREKKIANGEEINVIITKKHKENVLRETFGKIKFKKSTEEMMKETDKELYNE